MDFSLRACAGKGHFLPWLRSSKAGILGVQEVRARIGSGSNTTINDALKTWRESFLQRTAQAARRPDWPEGLETAVEALWQNACNQASRQWDSERAHSQQQLATAQAGQAAWQDAVERELLELEEFMKRRRVGNEIV